jgi:GR25 family glycosyltransferase involved in LPS biosynthesis
MTIIGIGAYWNQTRWDNVVSQLKNLGIPHKILSAFHAAKNFADADYCYATAKKLMGGRGLTCNEIGCTVSHGRALRLIADSSEPVMIVEDDLEFIEPKEHILEAVSNLPADFDFALTSTWEPRHDSPHHWRDQNVPGVIQSEGWWDRCYRTHHGTTSVIISPKGARTLLETWYPVAEPADMVYRRMSHVLNAYVPKRPFTRNCSVAGTPAS